LGEAVGADAAGAEAGVPAIGELHAAAERLAGIVRRTPLLASAALDRCLGHELLFKPEGLQHTGAFKIRGAYNTLAWMAERGALPGRVVSFSSGNHAQAVAWSARRFGVPAVIYMPEGVAEVKRRATEAWGAEVRLRPQRAQAEAEAQQAASESGSVLLPPYDHPQVVCGQGTATLEALSDAPPRASEEEPQRPPFDAVFVPVGGGGLMSGTTLAAKAHDPRIAVVGGEPAAADDAARTLESGALFRWGAPPETVADGARTLSLSPLTWACIRRADGILRVDEAEMLRWACVLQQELRLLVEPTSALAMAAAERWLATQATPQRVLVVLSGANLDPATQRRIWAEA
jgi:threonine dehydratase